MAGDRCDVGVEKIDNGAKDDKEDVFGDETPSEDEQPPEECAGTIDYVESEEPELFSPIGVGPGDAVDEEPEPAQAPPAAALAAGPRVITPNLTLLS